MNYAEYDRVEARESFRRDGYVYFPAFIDQESVEEVMAKLDDFIENKIPTMPRTEVYYEEAGDLGTLKQFQKLHEYDDFFHSLFIGGPLQEVAETLLDDNVVAVNLQYFNKPPKIGKPTPPHQDGYYFMLNPCEAVTMWLALDRVDEANGCVRYIPGSHTEPVRTHGRTKTLGFSQGITDYGTPDDVARERAFPAHPGDLLVHHAMTIHRADGNSTTDRHRRALGLVFFAERAKEDKEARAAYQKTLNEELLRTGKV